MRFGGKFEKTAHCRNDTRGKSDQAGQHRNNYEQRGFSRKNCDTTRGDVDFFYTSDSVVCSASEKLRLGETADAVDMESFQVMTQASLHGVPAVALRAVSDPPDRDVPFDFNNAINEQGEVGWLPLMSQVAATPWRLPQMIRFGFESSMASRNLAHFLEGYLNCLAADAILYSDHVGWEA
jgi:hypothetical protein